MSDVHIPQAKGILVDTRGAEIIAEDSPSTRDSRGIYLPHYIEPVSHIAIDIGGSLAKVVYFTRSPNPPNGHSRVPGISNNNTSPSSSSGTSTPHAHASSSKPQGQPTIASYPAHPSFVELDADEVMNGKGGRGDAWTPSINGALTPELIASASASGSATPSGPGPSGLGQVHMGGHKRTSSGSVVAGNGGGSGSGNGSGTGGKRSSGSFGGNAAGSRGGKPRGLSQSGHALLRRSSLPPNFPGGTLNFLRFETERIPDLITFLNSLITQSASTNHVTPEQMRRGVKIIATGGGAHKYYEELVQGLGGVEVKREEEMECLTTGLGFITCIPEEVFWYSDELVYEISHGRKEELAAAASTSSNPDPPPTTDLPRPSPEPPTYQVTFDTVGQPQYPCLLVNIGSGVSIVKVDEDGTFERVSGTSVGGGTLWGLLSLITDATTFDEMLILSERGDNAAVDMLVGDIYGSDYNKIGLKSSTIASSFGKVFKKGLGGEDRKKSFRQEDISKSLLYAVSNNIGQIAYMNAEKYGLDRIYFGGCFIRGHSATISTLSYAIRFWSRGTVRAMFLRHEGFLGSIGAWIKNVNASTETVIEEEAKES